MTVATTNSPLLFFIGGLGDIDLATNQSLKNTIKYLSEFGYRVHHFGAFPNHYRILQNPKKIFNERVVFHRSPDFLTPLFNFGRSLKNTFGMQRTKNQSVKHLKATQKIQYYDEYSFLGRLFYIGFFFGYAFTEILRVSYYYFKFKPDLFYGINGPGSALATFFGRLYRKPAIQRWHGCSYTEEDILRIRTRFTSKFLTLDGGFAKWLPSDAVVVTNDGTQGEKRFRLIGVPPEKLYFWMNGMDIEDMTLPEGWNPSDFKTSLGLQDKKILIMASRLVLWKRIDRGIDCLYRLVKEHGRRDVVLLVLGEGPERAYLTQLAEELGISEWVHFLGAIPHGEIVRYYSVADIFLSLYDVSNLGNPLLEAMCCGLPIVSIADGSTCELLRDEENAVLVPYEQLETTLPSRVLQLLEDEPSRRRLGENARNTYSQKVLSWKDRIRLEHDLIQRLIR